MGDHGRSNSHLEHNGGARQGQMFAGEGGGEVEVEVEDSRKSTWSWEGEGDGDDIPLTWTCPSLRELVAFFPRLILSVEVFGLC